jgi:uncharacterized protein YukE
VGQLLGWQPEELTAAGTDLGGCAERVQRAAGDVSAVRSGLGPVWSGAAAQAADAHTARRAGQLDELAAVVHTAGSVLVRAGGQLQQAHAALQAALSAAAAVGCTVGAGGAVSPPARPAAPAALTGRPLTDWQHQQDGVEAHLAGVASRLTGQVEAALDAAGAADAAAQTALAGLVVPPVSPAPRPTRVDLPGGDWGAWPLAAPAYAPTRQPERHWWERAGSALGDAAGWAGHRAADVAGDVRDGAEEVADALYDTGSYAVTHPLELVPMVADAGVLVGGAFLMAAGATGEVGGVALDATGVGAAVGVPLNLASAAVIATGAGLAGVGASRFGDDMSTMYDEAQDSTSASRPTRSTGGDRPAGGPPDGPPSSVLQHQRHLAELRADMAKPHVQEPRLAELLDELYRDGATVGSGSTAAAVREELLTGGSVRGLHHTQKAENMIRALEKWLSAHPQAGSGDRAAAENVVLDLRAALKGE